MQHFGTCSLVCSPNRNIYCNASVTAQYILQWFYHLFLGRIFCYDFALKLHLAENKNSVSESSVINWFFWTVNKRAIVEIFTSFEYFNETVFIILHLRLKFNYMQYRPNNDSHYLWKVISKSRCSISFNLSEYKFKGT